jgi:hypothetical protein
MFLTSEKVEEGVGLPDSLIMMGTLHLSNVQLKSQIDNLL